MTSSKRNFTMNDLKLPDILFDVYNGGFFHCTDLIKPSYKYLETMRATMNNWSIVQGQIKRKKLDSDTAVRKMTDSLKEYNKLPHQKQLLVLTCIARNLPLTVVRASETDVRLVDILTIDTGLDIGTFVHTFVNLVETMVNESESSAEVKTDGSFVFALRLNFNDRKTTYKTCYISIDDSEAKNIIKQSSSSVLLPNSDGFRLSEDETTMIKHYSLNSNFIKVEERLRNDFGLKLELKTEGSGENEIDVCLLLNMNSFPIRTENLYTIVLFTALEELKGRKMTKTPKQDNKTWQQAADEHVGKPIHSAQEITQAAANSSIPKHEVGNAVTWKFTDIFAAVKFAISSIETSSGSNVLIANLCEFLETKPRFVNLLKTYVQNVEKYNRIITIRGMNSCLDVLEYNTKHGTDYDYVPNPGSLMEPRYGWEHIDPETGASSFQDHPQQPSAIQSDYVVQPPPSPECLNPPQPVMASLGTPVSTSFPEPNPLTHTEKEVIMTLPEIKNGELAELFAKIDALETKVKEQEKRLELITVQELRPVPGSFSVFKVAELPKSLRPDSMYFVGDTASRKFDIYVSGVNGEMYSLNRHKEEKQHVVAARTLELSDTIAVRRWLEEAKCTATYIAMYLKATNPPTTAKEIELQKLKSVSQLLEETTATLEKISDKAERQCQLLELDLAKVVHNSTVGAFASIPKHNVKVQNSSASGCVARTEQPTGPSLTEQVRSHVANSKELIKQTHQKPDTGMELTGWRELSALAKHLNIDLSDIYVFLTSDGKVEIREHVMFPSKEYLDQIGKPSTSTTNPLTEHPMSNSTLIQDVNILFIQNVNTLFLVIQGRDQSIDAVEIGNYNEQIRDLFFAVERELALHTESALRELAHSGYKASVNYIPIPGAAPLCTRMFQIGKDGRNLSFAFYDSIPIRLAPQPTAPSNSDGSDITWQAAPLRQA